MTEKQKLYRSFLRERNRAKRYRKQKHIESYVKKKVLKGTRITHRTNPDFLNDNSLKYTLCGLGWEQDIDSVMLSRYETTCIKCLNIIQTRKLPGHDDYFWKTK